MLLQLVAVCNCAMLLAPWGSPPLHTVQYGSTRLFVSGLGSWCSEVHRDSSRPCCCNLWLFATAPCFWHLGVRRHSIRFNTVQHGSLCLVLAPGALRFIATPRGHVVATCGCLQLRHASGTLGFAATPYGSIRFNTALCVWSWLLVL